MLLKKEPAYRKAEKEDFPLIREFIRRNYKDRWEFEEAHTEKRLTRLLFYTYMISRDSITVATYRDQVVGVLITGKGSKVRFAPVFRLKKGYHFLRLKLTREGRKNLEHFNKLQDMKNESDNRGLLRIRLTSLFFLHLYIFFLFRIKTRKGNASTYQIARTAIPAAIKNPNTAPIRIPSASTLVVPDKSIFIEIMITIYGIPIGTPYTSLN